MEEFLKSYFVQHKQLILDNLGIISLKVIPAYFDKKHQKLFPSYLNYAFIPDTNQKNNAIFFDEIAQEFDILNYEAQQLYKNFVFNLIADFEKKSTFTIPHFVTVRKINNAYLVEIDSNLQIVFNPISVCESKPMQDTLEIIKPTSFFSQNQRIKQELHSSNNQEEGTTTLLTSNIENKKHPIITNEKILIKKPITKKNHTIMIYLIIIIVFLSITLIGIKFLLFNNNGYLSSLWK